MTPPNRPPRVGDIVRGASEPEGVESMVIRVVTGPGGFMAHFGVVSGPLDYFCSWDEVVYLGSLPYVTAALPSSVATLREE